MKKKIQKFEELIAWQKARKLTARIYSVTNEGGFAKDYGLKDQVRRAAVSTMSNMAEGFERGAEFNRQLYVAVDVGRVIFEFTDDDPRNHTKQTLNFSAISCCFVDRLPRVSVTATLTVKT